MDNKKGFTLIELLIVVVIIGILAAIAIPRFGETRERAFRSAVTSDLRNLQTVQEQYYFDEGNYNYGATTEALGFQLSDGVTGITITLSEGNQAYSAQATHQSLGANVCTLSVGLDETDDGIVCDWHTEAEGETGG